MRNECSLFVSGFVALVGMFLSCGIQISTPIPKNVLVDWEVKFRFAPFFLTKWRPKHKHTEREREKDISFVKLFFSIDNFGWIGMKGILRPTPREFIDTIKPWMYPARKKIDMEEFDKLPKVREVIPDLRHLIMALNVRFEYRKTP
jgi:hypothetical protein